MKTVLFCIHKQSPFYKVIPQALSDLGFKTHIFDYYQPAFSVRLLGLFNNLLNFDQERKIINNKINSSLLDRVEKLKPDYLLIIKGLHIYNDTIEKVKQKNVVTINWFQDLLEFIPWLLKHAGIYDYLFTPDPLMQRELKKLKITSYYLPLASNPDKKQNTSVKKYGVVFSGQHTKRREKLFSKLTQLGDDFVIWGYPAWEKSSLFKHYKGLLPSVEAMLQKFRESKIVINVQTAEDKYPSEVVSLRAFEATGVGTFLLNWKHKSIDQFWFNKKEIVNFKTAKEALLLSKYYLSYDKERQKIALAGYKRTKKDHAYIQRLKYMFKIVENSSKSTR